MNQHKVPFFALIILITLSIIACKGTIEPVGVEGEYDYVAVTAHYYENGDSHIYLVDYNNPSKFTRITSRNTNHEVPHFSPDRKSLVYGDFMLGDAHNPGLIHYDIESAIHDTLFLSDTPPFSTLSGHITVWNPAGSIFYYYRWFNIGMSRILSYNILTSEESSLDHIDLYGGSLTGFSNPEMMIVQSKDTEKSGGPEGYFYMDFNGEYHGRINNPHLERIVIDHVIQKAPYDLIFNMNLQLFAFAQRDSSIDGYEISLTNLTGTYYKRFTSGYRDGNPCWGPRNNIIIFDRAELSDKSRLYTRIMQLNTESGEIKEFVHPALLDGSEGVSTPSY